MHVNIYAEETPFLTVDYHTESRAGKVYHVLELTRPDGGTVVALYANSKVDLESLVNEALNALSSPKSDF